MNQDENNMQFHNSSNVIPLGSRFERHTPIYKSGVLYSISQNILSGIFLSDIIFKIIHDKTYTSLNV